MNQLKNIYFLLLTICVSMLFSCSESENNEPEPTPKITITSDESVVSFEGGSSDLNFFSSVDWTITIETTEGDSDWCTVSPTSGKAGDATVTIGTKENIYTTERRASIIIKAGSETKNALVIQKEKEPISEEKDMYESTDYSKDGEVMILQNASVGNGVDLVFMGDGFVDRDMNTNGKYEQIMKRAMEHYFSIEPNKTYRNYYNVYAVKAVSKNEVYNENSETKFDVFFGEGPVVQGNDELCIAYAKKTPIKNIDDIQLTMIFNTEENSGSCFMYASGTGLAYVSLSRSDAVFQAILLHESAGHGFGKLADEYFTEESGIIWSDGAKELDDMYESLGWYGNVSPTDDPTKIRWKHFLSHPNYSTYTGIYEGGWLRDYGVWRPEEWSCMRNNSLYFNAPSREAIVKRIKKIAGEPYAFEDFVARDKYERNITRNILNLKEYEHTPPVVIKGAFRGSQKKSKL